MLHGASVAQSQNPCLLRSELEALQTQRALIARVVPDSQEKIALPFSFLEGMWKTTLGSCLGVSGWWGLRGVSLR